MPFFHSLVLALLFFVSCLAAFSHAASGVLFNRTIGLDNPAVTFSAGWRIDEFTSSFGTTFAFANGLGDEVIVELPANTVDMYYVGFKRSGGGFYAACLDCELSAQQQQFQEVNAHDPSVNGDDPPVTLFSFSNLDPSIRHALSVVNLDDPDFGDTSQITFVAVIVTVLLHNDTSTSSAATLSTSSTTRGITGIPPPTQTSGSVPTISSKSVLSSSSIVTSSITGSSAGTTSSIGSSAASTVTAGNPGQPSSPSSSATSLPRTASSSSTTTTTMSATSTSTIASSANSNTTTSSGGSQSTVTSAKSSTGTAPPGLWNSGNNNTSNAPSSSSTNSASPGGDSQLPDSSGSTRSLSNATIAVIAVVSSLAFLAVLGTIIFILRRARNKPPLPAPGAEDGVGLIGEVSAPLVTSPIGPPSRPPNPYAGTVPSSVPITSYSHMPVQFPPPIPSRSSRRPPPQTTQAWINRDLRRQSP